jgi:hypothetical protein
MFHMDMAYMWRWYINDARGNPIFMSASWFFKFEDARRDYDDAQAWLTALAA